MITSAIATHTVDVITDSSKFESIETDVGAADAAAARARGRHSHFTYSECTVLQCTLDMLYTGVHVPYCYY